jgi:hypothetical protein
MASIFDRDSLSSLARSLRSSLALNGGLEWTSTLSSVRLTLMRARSEAGFTLDRETLSRDVMRQARCGAERANLAKSAFLGSV